MLTSRSFFWVLTLLVSVAVELPRADAASAGLTKIRVGYPSPSASMYPLFVTKEAGIFEKYGLDAELIYVQGVQMVQVHTAGQLDFTSTSGIVTLQSSVNGSDLILLANSIESHLMKVIAHPSVSGPADLKGKSIGVTRFGSLTDLALRPILEQWKLEPNKDVSLVQIGRLSDFVPAIQQKRIAAGMLSFPTSFFAEKLGLKSLYDLSESGIEVPTTTIAVSRAYAQRQSRSGVEIHASLSRGHSSTPDGQGNEHQSLEKIRRHSGSRAARARPTIYSLRNTSRKFRP